jgi:hypothetical protein
MTQEINLDLASGAKLTLLYFSDQELRWIYAYDYIGERAPGADPEVVNKIRLLADYADGHLAAKLVLSMHVIIPSRLGVLSFLGMDISPGAKTYLEFIYERTAEEYRLTEICKGARDRVRLDTVGGTAIVKPIAFPFPIPDRVPILPRHATYGHAYIPFCTNDGSIAHFDLPTRTRR